MIFHPSSLFAALGDVIRRFCNRKQWIIRAHVVAFLHLHVPPATADLSNLKINLSNEEKKKFQNIFLNIILVQFFLLVFINW